ncbi:MAG: GntR family transcriptional regulator [Blautia sp.]|jgi:DNA-binding GntR family transcriptional regulator
MFHKVKYSSLNELIYEEIKDKIINNELKPNDKLDIDYLSSSMGVSRTPVTNALKALQKDGYVVINPRSGSYVRELTKEEIEYIFDFREVLEGEVVRKVLRKLDKKQLKLFEEKFEALLNISFVNNEVQIQEMVKNFFGVEIHFHEYLINACPKIIGGEIMNLIDLTKRIRKLHIIYKLQNMGWECFKEEIKIHAQIIRMLLEEKLEESIQWMVSDIHNTKDEIIECFDVINQW